MRTRNIIALLGLAVGFFCMSLLGGGVATGQSGAGLGAGSTEIPLRLELKVKTDVCLGGSVQCTDLGATGAAVVGNDNPVRIVAHLTTELGRGVPGLTETDWLIDAFLVPAGGANLVMAPCAQCFQQSGTGSYAFFARPVSGEVWKRGTYFVEVAARPNHPSLANTVSGLVQLDFGGGGYEPFTVEVPGGLANSAAAGSANPEIRIGCSGASDTFSVTSIVIETDIPLTGFGALCVNHFRVDSSIYPTATQNICENFGQSEAADLMGMPVRSESLTSPLFASSPVVPPVRGCFPTEIVGTTNTADSISIRLFARSDVVDLSIGRVLVSGWKLAGDEVTVTYVPGV